MKNQWKVVKSIVLLVALPLVATAAASAHQWLSDTSPISTDSSVVVKAEQLGSARIHSVALNSLGAIEGRIAAINPESKETSGLSELKIYFVRDGKIAKEAVTKDDGSFVIEGVAEGAYSFVATGKSGFAAYGVNVIGNNGNEKINVMEAAAVSPRFAAVKKILEAQLPEQVAQEILESSDKVSTAQVVGANRVRLQNGTLKGHVLPIKGEIEAVKGTYVHILQNDQPVAEVQADDKGSFAVADLAPGVYDFVAVGTSGFAAVSFEAVAQEEAGSVADLIVQSDTEEVPAAVPVQDAIPADIPYDGGGYGNSLDVCLTCNQDTGFVNDQLGYAGTEYYDSTAYSGYSGIEYAGQSVGCGCASGGSCGSCGDYSGYSSCGSCGGGGGGGGFGGGGYGGGGGLGRLLLLGGLAAGIVALADNPQNPPPVSNNN